MKEDIFRLKRSEDGAAYLQISEFDSRYPVRTFFTVKEGGVSQGVYASLNMGFATKDDRTCVAENRKKVFDFMGEEGYWEIVPHQIHEKRIACIRAEDTPEALQQKGALTEACQDEKRAYKISFPDTDATVTNRKNVILTSLHADCIPVWLYDPQRHAAGLAHAGWRGTRADIAAETAKKMCVEFGCRMEDIQAVIGPGISECCFEVGPEVAEAFAEIFGAAEFYGENGESRFCRNDQNGKYHLDLNEINAELLRRAGVGQVYVTGYCTVCEEELFYSYRRDSGVTGRMCGGIVLL